MLQRFFINHSNYKLNHFLCELFLKLCRTNTLRMSEIMIVTFTAPETTTEQKKRKDDWLTLGFVRYRKGLPVDKRASEEEHVEKTFASTGHISKYGHLRDL